VKLFRLEAEKCGGCGWATSYVYVIAESEEEAKRLCEKGEAGLCGGCMCDMLAEAQYVIGSKEGVVRCVI
jgi:hypothetical protein